MVFRSIFPFPFTHPSHFPLQMGRWWFEASFPFPFEWGGGGSEDLSLSLSCPFPYTFRIGSGGSKHLSLSLSPFSVPFFFECGSDGSRHLSLFLVRFHSSFPFRMGRCWLKASSLFLSMSISNEVVVVSIVFLFHSIFISLSPEVVVARNIFPFPFFPFPWELVGSGSTTFPFPVMSDRVPNLPSGLSDRLDRLPRI